MDRGLDELIESLLTEIAFSGFRGCTVSNLLLAIDSYYGSSSDKSQEGPVIAHSQQDLAVATKAWTWLAARPDVFIGPNRQYNHLSLQEVLLLPEEEEPPPPPPNAKGAASKNPSSANTESIIQPNATQSTSGDPNPIVRPRLHVSEEHQWRTITGHGPDLKRVPLYEWRALVYIASVKEKGILQGDLVRLTGQDKRSLPTRTDQLAKKGYVIKQPVVLRGGKSSKLWLAQFWEDAKEDQEREGLDYDKLDLSRAALTSDLNPVPFAKKWNGETIDYLALAQGFMAIVKAWELIRYCDARSKLGVGELVRQMRALAKTCRWLTNIGALSFVGAKFAGSNRLFKDCVKYIRDPTPAEWSHFRATPKTRMVMPSGRIGKRGDVSRAAFASQEAKPADKADRSSRKTKNRTVGKPQPRVIPSPWKPQKPLPNTAFEIIKRAGHKGTWNAVIFQQTLGFSFRRLISAMTGSISEPTNEQPSHLEHLGSTAKLTRIKKTNTYTFWANCYLDRNIAPSTDEDDTRMSNKDERDAPAKSNAHASLTHAMFSPPDLSKFSGNTASSLTEITQAKELEQRFPRKPKRKPPPDGLEGEPPAKTRRGPGRPPRYPHPSDMELSTAEEHEDLVLADTVTKPSPPDAEQDNQSMEPSEAPPLAPGVYRIPNPPKKGRPKKNNAPVILLFRSDKLKDPNFLGSRASKRLEESGPGNEEEAGTTSTSSSFNGQNESTDAPSSAEAPPTEVSEDLSVQETGKSISATSKKGGPPFKCGKCGNEWKNRNGLDYHVSKSRTVCNPNFVPPVAESIKPNLQKRTGPNKLPLGPKEQMELRFDAKKCSSSSQSKTTSPSVDMLLDDSNAPTPQSTIVLKDLEVYDVTDIKLPPRQKGSSTGKEKYVYKKFATVEDAQPLSTHGQPLSPAALTAGSWVNGSDQAEKAIHLHHSLAGPLTTSETTPTAGQMDNSRGDVLMKDVSVRKPLPSASSVRVQDSRFSRSPVTAQPYGMDTVENGDEQSDLSTAQPNSFTGIDMNQPSGDKTLASFAAKTKSNASFGVQRRDRTVQIVEYLLHQNGGVFPGLRSLFMALVSVWAKEFNDLAPPDRRTLQNTINNLERAGKLQQMHFFFYNDKGHMQECVVIAKTGSDSDLAVNSPDDPRVIAVKEKMREMYPLAYVPDAFSLAPEEAKLFDDLASSKREPSHARRLRVPGDEKRVQNIETLRYDNSVMEEIPIHRTNKRPADEAQADSQPTSKRARLDVEQSDERNRKPRRRPSKHELWDSGKLAVYIWSQRHKPDAMWDQPSSCLQDPTTGAWSWTPDTTPTLDNISTILSSVQTAKDIDAALKRQGRRALYDLDSLAEANREDQYGDHGVRGRPIAKGHAVSGLHEIDISATDASNSGNESSETSDEESDFEAVRIRPLIEVPLNEATGLPLNPRNGAKFSTTTPVSSTVQRTNVNLPHGVGDILKTARRKPSFKTWADPVYGEFLRDLKTIKKWEQSAKGMQVLTRGTIAPDHGFMSITLPESKADTKLGPTNLEWLGTNQFTAHNIPDEVKNAPREDNDYGTSYSTSRKKAAGRVQKRQAQKPRGRRAVGVQRTSDAPMRHGGFVEYKTRDLTAIPKQPRGRFNKPATHDEKLGAKREDELIAACVVFRTLLGGLDRNLDIGLLLKHFPGISLSALKKFWPRISRERRSYVQALTNKFQSAFLEAYEQGTIPPIDYDDIENYDWTGLILWATRLETHENIDLPGSLRDLNETHEVADASNENTDWRETWFATTSTFNRIEAIASETMSTPITQTPQEVQEIHERARTWVRSICVSNLKGVDVSKKVVPKLLELGNGDSARTSEILEKTVEDLNKEKVITRTKGKDMGGNFRLHGVFSKQLEKLASAPKFRQAIVFKNQLDEVFGRGEEFFIMPYAADDGSILAVTNLQSNGRINIEPVDMPNIPFGFEPGNYEGRTFPKSYYHFKVRLVPTETYVYNHDMALLQHAQQMKTPREGPNGKIPIWVDFFGKVNEARWADYVGLIVFALAIKGPMSQATCVTLLKPMIDEFEVKLIIDWLERLGLVQHLSDECGVCVAEWWWLVAGALVQTSDNARKAAELSEVAASTAKTTT